MLQKSLITKEVVPMPAVKANPKSKRENSSRTADKFVVRMPDGMRPDVEARAASDFISMNSFVVQAIAEKLDRDKRQDLLLGALAAQVQAQTQTHAGIVEHVH